MRLKTYVVNKVSEAIPMIKNDLGEDALILNTKKIKTGGFLGFFQKEQLEVIAAVEPEAKAKPEKASYRTSSSPPKEQAVPDGGGSNSELMKELKSIKQFMMRSIEDDKLPEALRAVNSQFLKEEIAPEIQTELFAELMAALEEHPGYTEQKVRELTRRKLIDLIRNRQTAPEDKNPEIICFIGPTGVGKTTSIAKIAADYMLREDKKVGLITSDTYRIAAVEQLKTYAGILNIPIQVVESATDLTLAMDELKECDIVLMDTAGRNYQQKQYIEDLEALLNDKDKIQINLVLSLTSKYEDMKKIIDNFQTIKMDQLLLTKKDETSSSGAILNLIYHYSLPIPFIANGQNVPDDIITVTPELIADFVLGEDDNG